MFYKPSATKLNVTKLFVELSSMCIDGRPTAVPDV